MSTSVAVLGGFLLVTSLVLLFVTLRVYVRSMKRASTGVLADQQLLRATAKVGVYGFLTTVSLAAGIVASEGLPISKTGNKSALWDYVMLVVVCPGCISLLGLVSFLGNVWIVRWSRRREQTQAESDADHRCRGKSRG